MATMKLAIVNVATLATAAADTIAIASVIASAIPPKALRIIKEHILFSPPL
jgi:hypothetical protein